MKNSHRWIKSLSRGWIKELFEAILKRPVDVGFEKSIKQGHDVCKLEAH